MRPVPLPVGPGQVSVWDHPRPPALEREEERIVVEHRGVLLADTTHALRVLETSHPPTYYVPPDDVALEHLRTSDRTSYCEYKGVASYQSVEVSGVGGSGVEVGGVELRGEVLDDVAWGYEDPSPGYEALAGHLAFYVAPFDRCLVGGELARPQPGGFYGGWVTHRCVGPFKGEPGTLGW